ncbi:ATP-binding cassette subfamily B protein [Streptomyces sp. 2333.5]|uniref:ABC transporter ATP-binding protein n=1 Tax=unclassified Streptomyces TaxID=2593676 RepID=UPI000899ADC3|nr:MULTISPECIES: ABC transporter ATP-binding protein [unclassified Streptomyces]PJJ05991.1 ATP-binding cassette subfamily B protein [Streptomyces sp. 2333.5]SEE88229.1 ATP-binding cassette, subfamily B [Streptomyces sp. 2314.4]SEF05796.1 ATP-binding cassette, subfamily B [Streptomyces sp. 2112.2]
MSSGLGTVRKLVALAPEARGRLRRAAALSVLSGVSSVAGLLCVAYAVGELVVGHPSGAVLTRWTLGALAGLLCGFAARWLAEHLAHEASYGLEVVLRRRLADALAHMPLGEVQRLGAGRIKKIVQDDVKALHNVVADALPFVGSGVAQPLAALLALGVVQWRLLLAVLLIVPLAFVCFSLLARDYGTQRERYNTANEKVNAAVVEFVQGMPVVRTFDDGQASLGRFATAVEEFTEAVAAWMATTRASGRLHRLFIVPLPTLLIVAATGTPMLTAGWISLTDLLLALLIGTMPIEAVSPLMHLTNHINDSKAGAVRIQELLDTPPLPEPEQPREPAGSALTFENVGFHYPGRTGQPALDGIDLEIPEGTVCALVGSSGAGKSTLARLIPRFHDVTSGTVRIGGTDVRDIRSADLLQHVSLVFQDPFLVSGTVAENIRLARPDATDDEVRAAAEAAAAHDFIVKELPDGYDTQVGERGGRLSGGQRQRLTIARAILSHAPVVILDEATAFTDPETEAAIQQALARLTRGRTVVIIAHRLATIADADQIVVLDAGRVAERGRHAELIAAGGRYADLWTHHQQAADWDLTSSRPTRPAEEEIAP